MKRSKKVALMLMVPAATFWVAGCSDNETPEQALVFNSVEECAQSGLSTAEQCTNDWETAKALHPSVAPKFNDKQACESEYGVGHCETLTDSHSGSGVFMPMMMGFMAGNLLNRATPGQYATPNYAQQSSSRSPSYSGGGSYGHINSQPLYKSRYDSQSFRTADDVAVANRSGLTSVKPSQVQPHAFVSRGGFGSQGAMRSGAGG